MDWFSELSVTDLLARERSTLESILGPGSFSIEPGGPDGATLHSEFLTVDFGYERRIGWLGMDITLTQYSFATGMIETWIRFLGEDPPEDPTDANGRVIRSPEKQLHEKLKWLARLWEAVSDPQRARDAAYFVRGYNCAYNDYYNKRGPWSVLSE